MSDNNFSAIGGSFKNLKINFNPADRANIANAKSNLTTSGDIPDNCGGDIDKIYTVGSDQHFNSVRPTPSEQYTTGQLEYAKTCYKQLVDVEGYTIDNEFEEEHNITVEEVSFTDENNFDSTQHSDVVFGEDQELCGQGLRFRLNLEDLGKGVFEALWNLGGANEFEYFYNLDAMKLICQHEIPTLSELADHGCIAGYLIDFDYWYKIDKDIEGGDETYRANTYIKVMPSGEFEGNFAFADEEDVPIEECEEVYEVKDVVKLDINGIWVKERPDEGEIGNGGAGDSPGEDPDETNEKCIIKHVDGSDDCYIMTGISYKAPNTHSYDYGDVVQAPSFQQSKNPMPAIYFPEDHLQFIPVWDEVGFIQGQVPKVLNSDGVLDCPENAITRDSAVLYASQDPDIVPETIWDIFYFTAMPCESYRDQASGNPNTDFSTRCMYFDADVINPLSGIDGPGAVPEYWKTGRGEIEGDYYTPLVIAPENALDISLINVGGEFGQYVVMDAYIDCFLGDNIKNNAILKNGSSTCLHCDCHTVTGSSVKFDIGCDPCDKCGDGDKEGKMEEGPDYYHIQSICPKPMGISGSPSYEQDVLDGVKVFIKESCIGFRCENSFLESNIEFVLGPVGKPEGEGTIEARYQDWDVNWAYRKGEEAVWDYGYSKIDSNSVKYAEKQTYRCIISYNGGCFGGMDFMKKTPEFSGGSNLTATYRKIVDADEFNKCGSDRLPNLNYTDLDLLKVSVDGAIGYLDFFPQSAIAEEVELTPLQGGLDAYNLTDQQKTKIRELLVKLEKLDLNAVMHKTRVESRNKDCGMGAKFRLERDIEQEGNYEVHCRCDNVVPSLYADPDRAVGSYGTICKDDYDKIHADYTKAVVQDAGLNNADAEKILASHLYGPGTICVEDMRQAGRVPQNAGGKKREDNSDNWAYFGTRFVNCADGESPDPEDLNDPDIDVSCCYIKHEDKPVPRNHVAVDKRKCSEDLLTEYALRLIGYTQEDAENYTGPFGQVLFELLNPDFLNPHASNFVKPILPSSLSDENKPPFKIEVKKCLYSLKEYSFEIGDN